jgi:RNA polymerase sigma factor (sigma-70 family)
VAVDDELIELATAAIDGRDGALEQLLEKLRPSVVRTTRLVVGAGSPAAEDAAQEAMVDIFRAIGGLRDATTVQAWALRIAIRRALKVAASERRWWQARRASAEPATIPRSGSETAALKSAFDALPPRLRAVAVLRLYAGLSEAETATALNCPVGTVKSQLSEARKRLTDSLRRQGVVPTTAARGAPKEGTA